MECQGIIPKWIPPVTFVKSTCIHMYLCICSIFLTIYKHATTWKAVSSILLNTIGNIFLYLQLMCGNNEMHFSQSPPKMVVPINQVRRTIYILEHTVSVCVLKRLCGLLSTFQPRDFRCNLQVFAVFATTIYVCMCESISNSCKFHISMCLDIVYIYMQISRLTSDIFL